MFNVIRAVAEAKCPCFTQSCCRSCYLAEQQGLDHSNGCENACQGTGLRWPGLSRECRDGRMTAQQCNCSEEELEKDGGFHIHSGPVHQDDCRRCNGSGRIPDVSLEKVFAIASAIPDPNWTRNKRKFVEVFHSLVRDSYDDNSFSFANTWIDMTEEQRLEAACAALLESIKEVNNDGEK